jgi:DNA-binding beta-propeller fold protein YncE
MTRTFKGLIAAGILAYSGTLLAQTGATDLAFDSVDLLKTTEKEQKEGIFVGEVGGVGRDSRGRIFVYTRTGHPYATLGDNRTFYRNGSKLLQFDANGQFVRELGQDVYGFNAAYGLRVDPQDNVWTIDAGANQVVKFDSEGRVALVLGRKPEAIGVRPGPPPGAPAPAAGRGGAPEGRGGAPGGGGPAAAPGGGRGGASGAAPGSGTPGSTFNRPSDVAWDRAGNIYIADGMAGNVNRIAKFNKDGNFVKQWGSTGAGDGQFNGPKALAVDAQGNVYVLDSGNKRVQVFDGEGTFKSQFTGIGNPITMCMTTGPTQYLYISHAGDPDGMEDAAIYKVALDGKIVGKFGSAGKQLKQFGLANSIDCRNENELLVGEMLNWRVQKISLRK